MDDLYLSYLLSRLVGRFFGRFKLFISFLFVEGVGVFVIAVIDLKK